MIIESQHALIPNKIAAHNVVIRDDAGNAIFAAIHFADSIVYSAIGNKDFASVLRLIVDEAPPKVTEFPPVKK
jgi:hypothetical protein